jgi:predicted RNA-binding Zn ribbon-like protein
LPEHRDGTPAYLRDLESFLWWDFSDPGEWTDWARRRGWDHGEQSRAEAMRLHALLRELEEANSAAAEPGDKLNRLNAMIAAHGVRPNLSLSGALEFVPARADDVVGYLLSLTVAAMAQDDWRRFKLCREPSCRSSYFDSSKNAGKTWCSMAVCGARNKMRRYRAREPHRG